MIELTGRRGCSRLGCTRLALPGLRHHLGWPVCPDHAEPDTGMIGRVYLERREPVVCRARWATGIGKVIKNVLIERSDGTLVVRPFRGLRLPR